LNAPEIQFRTVEISDPQYEHEGLRFVTVKSPALRRRADCVVWSPGGSMGHGPGELKTLLILLHGVYGSAWTWALKAGVHRTASRMLASAEISPLAIAMPSDSLLGDGSAYLTYPGMDVERWIVDEVPALTRLAIPNLRRDARVAIAGLSMGGYAALRLGAKYADRFASISAHSAITDMSQMSSFVEEPLESFTGTASVEELNPLHWLLRAGDRLPSLRFDCGRADTLIHQNRLLHESLDAAKVPHHYEEFTGGHEWPYWAAHLSDTLRHAAPPTRIETRVHAPAPPS